MIKIQGEQRFPYWRKFTFWAECPASRTILPGSCFIDLSEPSHAERSEQLVRNAVYSGTQSGYAASGRRAGRGVLEEYRSALPQAVRLPAQLPDSQNDK